MSVQLGSAVSPLKKRNQAAPPATGAEPRPALMSLDDGAKELCISRGFFKMLEERGQVRLVRLGRRVLVPRSEIDRLIQNGATQED